MEQQDDSTVRTFKDIADEYLKLHVAKKCAPRTAKEYDCLLRLHIFPAFGSKCVKDIRTTDVAHLHESMTDTPCAANRAATLVATIWNWARDRKEAGPGENPAEHIEHYPETCRKRFLTSEEIGRLGAAIRVAETEGIPWVVDETNANPKRAANKTQIDPHAAAAIRLLILTGARLREILHAKWGYVDWERSLLHLPDFKRGHKTIYLSAAALAVLQTIPRLPENPYIIAGHGSRKTKPKGSRPERNTPRTDLKAPWAAVVRAAGFVERIREMRDDGKPILGEKGNPKIIERATVRIHDLRHSFASVGISASLYFPIVDKLLGHRENSTMMRDSHLPPALLSHAADIIGNQIAAAMEGALQRAR